MFVRPDFFLGQAIDLVWEDEPVIRLVDEKVGLEIGHVARRLVIDGRDLHLVRQVVPAPLFQFLQEGADRPPGIEDIVDQEQAILGVEDIHEMAQAIDADLRLLLVDARIGGSTDRDMVALDAAIFEQLLNRDADRRTAAPDADDMGRPKAGVEDQIGQAEGILQQAVGGQIDFGGQGSSIIVAERGTKPSAPDRRSILAGSCGKSNHGVTRRSHGERVGRKRNEGLCREKCPVIVSLFRHALPANAYNRVK